MRLAVIGAGYVGLVSGACFADFGHTVVCVDKDADKVAAPSARRDSDLRARASTRSSPTTCDRANSSFTTDIAEAVRGAEAMFIAVGTPSRRGDGHADLCYVYAAAREAAAAAEGFVVFVTKSTVPVGTGDEVERIVREANPHADFAVVSNPEFLREGSAIDDFKRPDRIVIGASERARARADERDLPAAQPQQAAADVRRPAHVGIDQIRRQRVSWRPRSPSSTRSPISARRSAPTCRTSRAASAWTTESARNSCTPGRAMAAPAFPRIRWRWSRPARTPTRRCASSRRSSRSTTSASARMAKKVIAACGGSVRGKTIGLLGLAFKPNTDDMRDAPSLALAQALDDAGARAARLRSRSDGAGAADVCRRSTFCDDAYDCATGAEALVIVTEWDMFRALDFSRLAQADGRQDAGRSAQRLQRPRTSAAAASPISASACA